MVAEVCPTGIAELDRLLGGGIPRRNVVLIAGTPGAGKTTFGAKFIYEGLRREEPGVYLIFLISRIRLIIPALYSAFSTMTPSTMNSSMP